MNFLTLRSSQVAAQEQRSVPELHTETNDKERPAFTMEGLIAEDSCYQNITAEDPDNKKAGCGGENGCVASSSSTEKSKSKRDHIDVNQDEGWIAIPYGEIPQDWNGAAGIESFRLLDRCFVFPGEQVHILACLSAYKQDTEIITPFKVAEVMSKNGKGQNPQKQQNEANPVSEKPEALSKGEVRDQNGENDLKIEIDSQKVFPSGESLLRMENHRRQTEELLQSFKNSHFFVRISESSEPLWSKRKTCGESQDSSKGSEEKYTPFSDSGKTEGKKASLNVVVDRGGFDAHGLGGVARNVVKCCSLSNGDIVVLLDVNVGVDFVRDPVLEILQFEQTCGHSTSQNKEVLVNPKQDCCDELLKWLLPLDNSIPLSSRPLSPPPATSTASIRSTSVKPTLSVTSGSQLFSFGNFRSYSMSSLPPSVSPPPPVVTANSRSSVNLDESNQFSFENSEKSEKRGIDELLSFRGVTLEPERFSVRCGLEGIYVPGRRWRKKIEIINPLEIHSFVSHCNTDDLLCVQIKNVSPLHAPDIVVYIDSIAITFEKASNSQPPQSIPIACIESGDDHSLPNLALRRGEEHSFILKPITSLMVNSSERGEISHRTSSSLSFSNFETGHDFSPSDQYAVLVSCRCNYTESKLFFKQPTSWQPRTVKDLMITVVSEMSGQTLGSDDRVFELPVKALTLQASNLTPEDLTLTVLAPASFSSPPSVVSLNSSPSLMWNASVDSVALRRRVIDDGEGVGILRSSESKNQRQDRNIQSQPFNRHTIPIPDVLPSCGLGCTHLWLQNRVPLGFVPSQSMATIKLDLLPLTDGIITLDSLQIDVKEKGLVYVPKHSLKINATSSVATGVV